SVAIHSTSHTSPPFFSLSCFGDHRPRLSFPTRRSSDLALQALPCQFPDVARRQRKTAGAAASASSLEYWRQQLSGIGTLELPHEDRKSTRLNSSHVKISYAVFCLKKKKKITEQ